MITNIPNATWWDPDSTQLKALLSTDTISDFDRALAELHAELQRSIETCLAAIAELRGLAA